MLHDMLVKAVGADNSAGVDGDPMADLRLAIQDHVREKADIVAELAISADIIAAHENRTGA